MNDDERARWRREIGAKYPHHVDVVPPPEGFSLTTEEEIIRFLEPRAGVFDLYGEIENGVIFVRYCFLRAEDAQAFRATFGGTDNALRIAN